MRRTLLLFLLFAVSLASPVKNFIVLMMENRSFDHMLGYLKQENPDINGLTGSEYNLMNATDPNSNRIYVSPTAPYVDPDPGHSVPMVAEQFFGTYDCRPEQSCFVNPPPMNGYVQNAERIFEGFGNNVMRAFDPDSIPVLSTLAREFAVFDEWYSSIPGNTFPNRLFLHAATSLGMSNNDLPQLLLGLPGKTVFENLDDMGFTFANYFHEVPGTAMYNWMRRPKNWSAYHHYSRFAKDAKDGTLPTYSFIDPRYFDIPGAPANDDHPNHDVSEGQQLMKEVYEAIRNGPQWNTSALIITYDEHGGFYDHVSPPLDSVPNPDGLESETPYVFDFKRLGIRVPTVVVSPLIPKGTVVHKPNGPTPNSAFDHSSVSATFKKMFSLPTFLTKRDEWAGTFEHIFSLTSPRTDAPTELPTPKTLRHIPIDGDRKLTELQEEFVHLAAGLNNEQVNPMGMTVKEGATFIKKNVNRFFKKDMYKGTPDEIDE